MISYGDVDGVALYCQQWTNNEGTFDDETTPSRTMVGLFLADISAIMATALAKNGFTDQLAETDALAAVNSMVNQMAAELVRRSKNSVKLSTKAKTSVDDIRTIISAWADDQAAGLEQLGAARQISNMEQVAFREYDPRYGRINPLFQRGDFNNDLRQGHNHGRNDEADQQGQINGEGFAQP